MAYLEAYKMYLDASTRYFVQSVNKDVGPEKVNRVDGSRPSRKERRAGLQRPSTPAATATSTVPPEVKSAMPVSPVLPDVPVLPLAQQPVVETPTSLAPSLPSPSDRKTKKKKAKGKRTEGSTNTNQLQPTQTQPTEIEEEDPFAVALTNLPDIEELAQHACPGSKSAKCTFGDNRFQHPASCYVMAQMAYPSERELFDKTRDVLKPDGNYRHPRCRHSDNIFNLDQQQS